MDMTMLLIGSSIAAGAHMVLFWGAATLAWIYFKRCRKLRAQIAEGDISEDRDEEQRGEGREVGRDRENRNSVFDHPDDHRRSRDGNRYRESTTGRARRERRHQRFRERPRDDSSPYPQDRTEDESPPVLSREQTRITSPKSQERSPRDGRGNVSA